MVDTERVQAPLKKWKIIKQGWNDKKSRTIENTCLDPLNVAIQNIRETLLNINEFVVSMENQVKDIEDS